LEVFLSKDHPIILEQDFDRKFLELTQGSSSTSLKAGYDEIFHRNTIGQPHGRYILEKTFMWMLSAAEPLATVEILKATIEDLNAEEVQTSATQLLKLGSNFLIENKLGILQFTHHSVIEYLQGTASGNDMVHPFAPARTHQYVATLCLRNFLWENARDRGVWRVWQRAYGLGPTLDVDTINKYAMLYWPFHCKAAKNLRLELPLQKLISDFLQSRSSGLSFTSWANEVWPPGDFIPEAGFQGHLFEQSSKDRNMPNPVYVCCTWGFKEELEDLLRLRSWSKFPILRSLKEPEILREQNRIGKPPLCIAASFGYLDIVEALLSYKSSSTIRDKYGRNSLHCAAMGGHSRLVMYLLEKVPGVNVDDKDAIGRTPLLWAARSGDVDLFKLLAGRQDVLRGRNDNIGSTCLSLAAAENQVNILQTISSWPWKSSEIRHAITEAIRHERVDAFKFFLEHLSALEFLNYKGLKIERSPYLVWHTIHQRTVGIWACFPPNSAIAELFSKSLAKHFLSTADKVLLALLWKLWGKIDLIINDQRASALKLQVTSLPEESCYESTVLLLYLGLMHFLEMISDKKLRIKKSGEGRWIMIGLEEN
jgi:hypothetical protein